ncbi:hypothetical protein [Confluentibacter lentus]|uniref:hypothetical protein n=1 Tax=Confluentibacter lentus TaxID=1699412 RepID=UPI000C28EFEF|nr:hypothetical protein [Confluentibacter lentus]
MRTLRTLLALTMVSIFTLNTNAQTMTKDQKKSEKTFIKYADEALKLMTQEALKMDIKGVGIVCYIPGNETKSWISKMIVVKTTGTPKQNFIAVAHSKAAEMAETLINSGSNIREIKTGEFGYIGGVIKKIDSGYLLATFSGATGEQDVEVATKVLDWLVAKF